MSRLVKQTRYTDTRQWRNLMKGFCLSSLVVCSSVLADDTEVFYGQVASSVDTQPNVLFVLDTSSSMNSKDGTGVTRLQRMKDALTTILDEATNVNVGIMRFNGASSGSSVIVPVTPIDSTVCSDDCGVVSISSQVGSSWGDVEEHLHTNGVVNDSSIIVGSTGSHEHIVGFQFTKLAIPTGATILSAEVEFTAKNNDSSDAEFLIGFEQIDNAAVFDGSTSNISGRSTGTELPWTPDAWVTDDTYKTPDLKSMVQEVVDRSGWCGGNAMNLIIKNNGTSGKRRVQTFDHSTANAPVLRISYDTSTIPATGVCTTQTVVASLSNGNDDDAEETVGGSNDGDMYLNSSDLELPYDGREQIVGLRFRDVAVPQGANIIEADIQFIVDEEKTGDITLKFEAESVDNAAKFTNTDRSVSSRSRTVGVEWVNPPLQDKNKPVVTPSLIAPVGAVVNRSGWSSGNSMAFIISRVSGSGKRTYISRNKSSTNSAKLRVTYQTSTGTSSSASPTIVTARDQMKQIVSEIKYVSGTPIVDAYYEAALYMRGGDVDYGRKRGNSRHRDNRVSHPDSHTGAISQPSGCSNADLSDSDCEYEEITGAAKYISPMNSSCQTNQIVLLSDGSPSSITSVDRVKTMMGYASGQACTDNSGKDACGRDFAAWLDDTDHSSVQGGKQNVSTFTIGFNFTGDFLKDMAARGGGEYFTADSSSELVSAFQTILSDVADIDTSFVSAGATVNQFNRLTHRDDLYFAVFKPNKKPIWDGNIKRYNMGEDTDGNILIMDDSNPPKAAVDEASGFFHDESRSGWLAATELPDGNEVSEGGAAARQLLTGIPDIGDRRVYTYVSGSLPATLNAAGNKLHEDTSAISNSLLNITTTDSSDLTTYRENIIKWARGVDVLDSDVDGNTTEVRKHIGDPMHSRPVIVNYANGTDEPFSYVFVGTNEGFLHAINTDDGHEQYSFIPPELLKNLKVFYENKPVGQDNRPYGLDGAISLWTKDVNGNVTIDSGDEAYLFLGMRRGGNNYYAMNITERLNPKLEWVINGGSSGFEDLGQTWSKPIPTKIKINGAEKEVLIFAGGYDESEDPVWGNDTDGNYVKAKAQSPSTSSLGRAIYIVDAEDGTKLWSGTHSSSTGNQTFDKMKYSIPSDIRVIDVDFDGLVDQMYVGDIGGQVWRFDMNDSNTGASDLFYGNVIADLSDTSAANQRRFFYEPDVAMVGYEGERFLTISIGSGWRARPLDEVTQDRIYVLRTSSIHNKPAYYGKKVGTGSSATETPLTEADLVNVTNDLNPALNQYGWYIDMGGSGEKILSRSVTFDNQIFFTSYKPGVSIGACTTAIGSGSIYVMNVINGKPVIDMDDDGVEETADRELALVHGGIPPDPNILITDTTKGPTPSVMVGAEKFDFPFDGLTKRTFWVDLGQD